MEVSRTLADPSFVVFCCVFADILRLGLRPFIMQVQGVLEPAVFKQCERRAMEYICRVQRLLPTLRSLLRVVALLRQYLQGAELLNLMSAFRWSALARTFPTFFEAVPGLLAQRPSYGGDPLNFISCDLNFIKGF